MVNTDTVENIEKYGDCRGTGSKKTRILVDEIGYPIGQKAEYAIITGCFQAESMPHVLKALKNVLDHYRVSYTLLPKEHCCGWMPLGQPAVMSKDEEAIARFKQVSRGFIMKNVDQAKAMGVKSIVLFCGACEPHYTNMKDEIDLEVISYSELMDRCFTTGALDDEIDYYAGCYRFRRKLTDRPVDIEPPVRILNRISGLKVNYLDNSRCCYIPAHLEQLLGTVKSNSVVNICSGCYYNLAQKLKEGSSARARMLPEVVWSAISGHKMEG
ncbi:MAG: (Fe-S)-binding protein [Dehalococcoidia bacterium]|nr:(Fe-S)-binding protein [Dehalococcoidia bacterium]